MSYSKYGFFQRDNHCIDMSVIVQADRKHTQTLSVNQNSALQILTITNSNTFYIVLYIYIKHIYVCIYTFTCHNLNIGSAKKFVRVFTRCHEKHKRNFWPTQYMYVILEHKGFTKPYFPFYMCGILIFSVLFYFFQCCLYITNLILQPTNELLQILFENTDLKGKERNPCHQDTKQRVQQHYLVTD